MIVGVAPYNVNVYGLLSLMMTGLAIIPCSFEVVSLPVRERSCGGGRIVMI
jgi:hypothetical protein